MVLNLICNFLTLDYPYELILYDDYMEFFVLNQKIEMHSTGDVSIRSNSTDDALYINMVGESLEI